MNGKYYSVIIKIINFVFADRIAEARSREQAGGSARHKGVFTKTHHLDELKSGKFLWNSQGCGNGRCQADVIYPNGNDM